MGVIHASLQFLLGKLAPGTGRRRRAGARQAAPTRPTSPPLPAHRSPYGLEVPLVGTGGAMIRPYLIEFERRQERLRRQRRCLTLVLAADFGIDPDRRNVHGAGVTR